MWGGLLQRCGAPTACGHSLVTPSRLPRMPRPTRLTLLHCHRAQAAVLSRYEGLEACPKAWGAQHLRPRTRRRPSPKVCASGGMLAVWGQRHEGGPWEAGQVALMRAGWVRVHVVQASKQASMLGQSELHAQACAHTPESAPCQNVHVSPF